MCRCGYVSFFYILLRENINYLLFFRNIRNKITSRFISAWCHVLLTDRFKDISFKVDAEKFFIHAEAFVTEHDSHNSNYEFYDIFAFSLTTLLGK